LTIALAVSGFFWLTFVALALMLLVVCPADGTFARTNNCPATLNPNTNCVIQVVFTPPKSGNFSATLAVTDGDKSNPQTASLSGVGLD
jgi:hypothetical protein